MSLKKAELESKWWHRLAKVIFVILTIVILAISSVIFYSLEEGDATHYTVIKTFAQFLQEEKDSLARGCPSDNSKPMDAFSFVCFGRLLAAESFISRNDLKDHSLGCLQTDGKVDWLSEYALKEAVTCDQKTGISCAVSTLACDGDAAHIVKYDSVVKYGIGNYFSIALKTLAVLLTWFVFVYLIYYKAFLYVIFGGKEDLRRH